MTACAFVHPESFPTLISDLVVSYNDGMKVLTPSNYGFTKNTSMHRPARLVRKSFMLPEGPSIFALAGRVDAIMDFRDFFPIQYKYRLSESRPMRVAGDIANQFNNDRGERDISLLGFSPYYPAEGSRINIVKGADNLTVQTSHFNECCATGSGAAELLKLISQFDKNVSSWNLPATNSYEHLLGLLGALNSKKLFEDTVDKERDTWGGYLEATTLLPNKTLHKRLSWSHIAYRVSKDAGVKTFKKVGKEVHYNPAGDRPAIGMRVVDKKERHQILHWPIEDLFVDPATEPTDFGVWEQFKPDVVTLCLVVPSQRKVIHRTLDGREMDEVSKNGTLDYAVSREVLLRIAQQIEF